MSALRKITQKIAQPTVEASLLDGDAVEAFTSSMGPVRSEMEAGDLGAAEETGLFTSSM